MLQTNPGQAHLLTWHVPTGLGPVSGLSVLQTNPPALAGGCSVRINGERRMQVGAG